MIDQEFKMIIFKKVFPEINRDWVQLQLGIVHWTD